MNKIQLLPDNLINQIAAGEVVERPASVVKELLENSIDAGAKRIIVEVQEGGMQLLKITDDGSGMSREDAELSLARHATSKIATIEDLQAIKTMGFRGEALASIASVSRFTMRTKLAADSAGTEIVLEGGKILRNGPIGIPTGTEIEVRELFFNTPARLKFMKSAATEYQNVVDAVVDAALAFPEIAFKLVENEGRIALDLPATADPLVRMRGVLGKGIAEEMLEIFYGGVNLKMTGYIGKPSLSRSNRNMQFFFVNNRPIASHVLSYAVKQAYHSLLPKERYPVFVVKFELEPSMVDVNCHPRKTEVKFKDEREIYRVLNSACAKVLEQAVIMPKFESDTPVNYYQEKSAQGITEVSKPAAVQEALEFFSAMSGEKVSVGVSESNQAAETMEKQIAAIPDVSVEMEMTVLAQLSNAFILCQRGEDLVIIDQHAAHERVRYNKLMAEAESEEKLIQPLLVPINIEVSAQDQSILDANKDLLEEIGLELEHFGGNTFSLKAVPAYLAKNNLEKVLLGMIDDLRNFESLKGNKGDLYGRKEKVLTYLACRSAVKFGDSLSMEEMRALVDQLREADWGRSTCPHGRPTMIVLPKDELWGRFGRKYTGFFEKEKFGGVNC